MSVVCDTGIPNYMSVSLAFCLQRIEEIMKRTRKTDQNDLKVNSVVKYTGVRVQSEWCGG